MCVGFYSNLFIDYILVLSGFECVSLGGGVHKYMNFGRVRGS